jgi:excinuclease ABC subunit C
MKISDIKKYKLPNSPGVYFFKKKKPALRSSKSEAWEILYIGKATSLKDRVRSYFNPDVLHTRGSRIVDMVSISTKIEFEKTDSVLEALILEANLIKKFEPKYNIKEKDNKSYNFVCITKATATEDPKIILERGRSLDFSDVKYSEVYGPFPSQEKLQTAMNIIRKIFPFKTNKNAGSKIYSQIGLEVEGEKLKKNIRNIKLFFGGKKKKIIKLLEKEMMKKAKEMKFEEAGEIKRQIFALKHINDVALIEDSGFKIQDLRDNFRIESYDVAHMSGKNSVGVMTVIEDGQVKKSEYKKFILRDTKRGDDVGGLREIITRRLKHPEWKMPNLIVVDGGKNQLNLAKKIIIDFSLRPRVIPEASNNHSVIPQIRLQDYAGSRSSIKIVSVLKDEKHKPKDILGSKKFAEKFKKEILIANNESHRFAIQFFRKKQRQSLF